MLDETTDKVEAGLRNVIRLGKVDILDQHARFESMLNDFCPRSGYSSALKHAVRLGIPRVLMMQASAGTIEPLIQSSTKRLHMEEGIDISIAAWTVRLLVRVLQEQERLPATSESQPSSEKIQIPPVQPTQSAPIGEQLPHPEQALPPAPIIQPVRTRRSGIGATFAVLGSLILISGVVWALKSNQSPNRPEIEAIRTPDQRESPQGRAEPVPEKPREEEPKETPTIQDTHGGEVKVVSEAHFSVEVPEGWTFSGPDNRSSAAVWTISNGSGASVEIHYPHSVKDDPNNTAADLQEYPRSQGETWTKEPGRNYTLIELSTVNFANRRACVWEYTRMANTELVHRHSTYLGRPYGHAIVLSTSEADWTRYSQALMDIRETFKVDETGGG